MNPNYIRAVLFLFIILISCHEKVKETPKADIKKTKHKAEMALNYCKSAGLNTDICVLIDMSVHSGLKRFFVWDFKKNAIALSCLVSHGCGDNPWGRDFSKESPKFSNDNGSHLSSLGKYKIGERGYSNWGINAKYLLHGLEKTNKAALQREIVFHSWEVISDIETYPNGTPEGWGCPAISNNHFRQVDSFLKSSTKPVLMWIYL
ncbi:MAG: murein L,D-transpeptidase catalytic domain family protein [Sphingobacteriales bacterium]|jgi:hypothetical protein|nr:murein L,D-transpeptidase catalytic domain family protein [Sphingobacteriales bacterium]MBP9142565.1 murein L,D-transpeptidase catalytic domain family protein [Chitinophagales bacterium]MBK6890488.1 murein L,D-transpeptidase catalytic domain family protein [Sphingobacteriales bacterium]MBK7526461.1 murein L,D-transpeptidase catalytic domain family protein [Sphingobacteriales bacterium]MBK8679970.1 murein L,D-transpeptidase catalytic domain family protein [Sphingobacteriales bacterium]